MFVLPLITDVIGTRQTGSLYLYFLVRPPYYFPTRSLNSLTKYFKVMVIEIVVNGRKKPPTVLATRRGPISEIMNPTKAILRKGLMPSFSIYPRIKSTVEKYRLLTVG